MLCKVILSHIGGGVSAPRSPAGDTSPSRSRSRNAADVLSLQLQGSNMLLQIYRSFSACKVKADDTVTTGQLVATVASGEGVKPSPTASKTLRVACAAVYSIFWAQHSHLFAVRSPAFSLT